jgi:eukaryotic-like serine/threonine-protein kinase
VGSALSTSGELDGAALLRRWDGLGARLPAQARQPRSATPYVIFGVAWSPDSKQVASAGLDGSVQISNALSGQNMLSYYGHGNNGVITVAWSPDGKHLVSGDNNGGVLLWEAATGNTIFTYRGHTGVIYCVAWSPDGNLIASGGEDMTVQIWKAQ